MSEDFERLKEEYFKYIQSLKFRKRIGYMRRITKRGKYVKVE